jgi:dethiobiotin synthetase
MNQGIFVTGTDTGCGKTRVSLALIAQLRARGIRVSGFKPVAAGSELHHGELRNDDALSLIAASGIDVSYRVVNPYCFEPAIAPHLAAAELGVQIEAGPILAARDQLALACEFMVVEGAGGWRVPLGTQLDIQGLALELGLPVLLVVGLRLGCLNHALLSEQSILASGARLLGWIGSQVDPGMARLNENIAALNAGLSRSCLGILPHSESDKALTRAVPLAIDYLVSEAVRA